MHRHRSVWMSMGLLLQHLVQGFMGSRSWEWVLLGHMELPQMHHLLAGCSLILVQLGRPRDRLQGRVSKALRAQILHLHMQQQVEEKAVPVEQQEQRWQLQLASLCLQRSALLLLLFQSSNLVFQLLHRDTMVIHMSLSNGHLVLWDSQPVGLAFPCSKGSMCRCPVLALHQAWVGSRCRCSSRRGNSSSRCTSSSSTTSNSRCIICSPQVWCHNHKAGVGARLHRWARVRTGKAACRLRAIPRSSRVAGPAWGCRCRAARARARAREACMEGPTEEVAGRDSTWAVLTAVDGELVSGSAAVFRLVWALGSASCTESNFFQIRFFRTRNYLVKLH